MTQITHSVVVVMLSTVALGAAQAQAKPPAQRTRASVLATVEKALPDVLACGDATHATVTARFHVAPDGSVRGVKIAGPQAKTPVGACMKKELKALRFSPAQKATPVTYPFRFDASARAQAPIKGQIARKELDGLLDVLEGDLKKCGEGEVRASFVVKPNGRPDGVTVENADDAKTGDCVQKRISRVRFPAAARPTPVERTFTLADSGEG